MESPGRTTTIELNRQSMTWDLDQGVLTTVGIPSVILWLDPSFRRLLQPLVADLGATLFRLMVAYESSLGTDEDYHAMITTLGATFEEGFIAWGRCVSASGWGRFELPVFDQAQRRALVVVKNPWELVMQRGLPAEERWGCPFLQGKIIGIFSQALGTNCWADEIVRDDGSSSTLELHIHASDRTIQREIDEARLVQRAQARRKLVQLARILRESEERQRAILSSISEVVFTLDTELRFTSYHVPEELAATYRVVDDVVGRTVAEVLPANVAAQIGEAMARLLESGAPQALSYERERGGEVRYFSAKMSVLRGAHRVVMGATVIERDLTERVMSERALAERLEFIERQRETIRAMSTPILQVWEGVLALPIIGNVDTQRAARITEELLSALSGMRARSVILDLTGVDVVDTATADHFARIVRAVELLGAECLICGIQPAVAQTMATLVAGAVHARTYSTMQSALESAIGGARRARRR